MSGSAAPSNGFVSAALKVPSGSYVYRFYLSAGLFLLMLFLLAVRYSEVGFFILVLINALFCADIFVRSAWSDLTHRKIGFSLLVSVAVYAGFIYSVCHTFVLQPMFGPVDELYLYVSFFLTLSLWVQGHRVQERERADVYIKKIDDFLPKSGRKCMQDRMRIVFAKELKEGDEVCVKPGERFPCDGEIISGKTSADEQLITGNQVPAYKQRGNTVYAGTVNKSSEVYVKVTKPLMLSALMHVVSSVQNCERRRSAYTTDLDAYSAWILLLLVLMAGGQYGWLLFKHGTQTWLYNSGALLVMLSLGAPVSLLFAQQFAVFFACHYAFKNGMRIQNHYALDVLAQSDMLFFDKTGTLTYGQLTVHSVHPASPKGEKALLEAVVCAEQQAEGPFASAIMQYAKARHIEAKPNDSLEILPGIGVRVSCGKQVIMAGRIQWMEEQGIELPQEVYWKPQTVICVAKNGTYLGYLTLADALRPGAKEVVEFLKKEGKELLLISGDNEPAVATVAGQVGIEKYNAHVLPKTKAEIITNLRELGKRVIMVGDGFNDLIALLQADGGIAYASSKNIYTNWVDILITRRDLYPLIDLFKIHQKIRRISITNVMLSFILSVLWVEFLFWYTNGAVDWRWVLGGSLAVLGLIFLNSTRLLKIK